MGRWLHGAALAVLIGCSSPPSVVLVDGTVGNIADAGGSDAESAFDGAVADGPLIDSSNPEDGGSPYTEGFANGIAFAEIPTVAGATFQGGVSQLDTIGVATGATIADVNGDGRDDIILANCDSDGSTPSRLLLQGSTGAPDDYVEDTSVSTALAGLCMRAAAVADFDGDGDNDVFFAAAGADVLMENTGAGLQIVANTLTGNDGDENVGAIWADVNADGWVDLYVLGHVTGSGAAFTFPNRLYINRGQGVFDEVASAAGVDGFASAQAAAIADLDGDGDLDIYVANDRFSVNGLGGDPSLDGDAWYELIDVDDSGVPHYENRGAEFGVQGQHASMGIALAPNPGGRPSLFVTDWGTNHLFSWNGTGYTDEASQWGLALPTVPQGHYMVSWSARFVDLDRDGEDEVFIVNGLPIGSSTCASRSQLDVLLRRNPGAPLFEPITAGAGLPWTTACAIDATSPSTGHGGVFGDLDGDGDDDLIVAPRRENYRFYRNETNTSAAAFVRVRPRGTVSSPLPIGAVLEVHTTAGATLQRIFYGGGDTRGHSAPVVEVALGTGAPAEAWMHWPSGLSQRIDGLEGFATNTEVAVVEPSWLSIDRRVVAPGAPSPVITYTAMSANGTPLGSAGTGRTVTGTRSDGQSLTFTDVGDGTYTAALPRPSVGGITIVRVSDGGTVLPPRPSVHFK